MNYESIISEEKEIKGAVKNLFYNGFLIQGNLFLEPDLNETLDEIFLMINQGSPLYQRWSQNIGGKERELSVPDKSLRKFLDPYLLGFIKRNGVHRKCHGGEKGWSPKTSLEKHLPCSCAFSFDLKSAFENVDYDKVYDFFYKHLEDMLNFNASEKEKIAEFFSLLCTVNYSERRVLPQGSPAGIPLFNRILFPLDQELNLKAEERGFEYSRWVDDMTLTSSDPESPESFLGALELVARNFPISREKTFFQDSEKIYLLGHKIQNNKVLKNTKEERLKEKCMPLNYEEWFMGKRKYELWG